MLLQRLVALSHTLAGTTAFYTGRTVRWQLNLTGDGALADTQLLDLSDPGDRTRKNGTVRAAPYLTRTSAVAPLLGTDSLEYVLGWCDDPARQAKADEYTGAFRALAQQWAEASADPAARALVAFYASDAVDQVEQPPAWERTQTVQIAVDGVPVADLPSAATFWAQEAGRRKSGSKGGPVGVCLVCGTVAPLLDSLPQQLKKPLVPLASKPAAAVVSLNKQIHTYDHSTGLSTTVPICLDCGGRSVQALTHVLGTSDSHLQFGDTRLAWWTVNADPLDLLETLAVNDPESVASLVDRVRRTATAPVTGLEPQRFCAVALAGNVSRVMVRDWIDVPLANVERSVATWFADHRIVDRSGQETYQPLWLLALATGRRARADSGPQARREYVPMDAKAANRPDDIGRALLRAALLGKPLPASLLAHLVTRIRTDGHLDAARAALLRLTLIRRPHPIKETPMPGLDPDNLDPAYLAGRVFAVLENLQRAAAGRDSAANTTFTDRYFAGAVANPRVALIQGRQLAAAWLKKLRRTQPGLAFNIDRELTDLFDRFEASNGIPGRIDVTEQAAFLLGVHHQRADTTRRRIAAAEARDTTQETQDINAPDNTLSPNPPVAEGIHA